MIDADLPPPPVYLPFPPGPYRAAMGLVGCALDTLTEIDAQYHEQMDLRRRLLATKHDEVFAACAGTGAMRAETLAVIVAHLLADRAAWFCREGDWLENRLTGERWNLAAPPCDRLELAGRLVQEDLCLLSPESPPVLVAAVLCFPSRWRLADKIGKPLAAVHAPVPLYAERLAAPVDRFLALLKPGRLVARMNWSVHDDPALFQPDCHDCDDRTITADNAGDRLTVRIERQSLMRLPETGAILFTIRTHRHRLAAVAAVAGGAASLRAAIAALPADVARYKGIARFAGAIDDFLASDEHG